MCNEPKTKEPCDTLLKSEYISNELDNTITQEYNARMALDTKLFSSLGVIVAILTILCNDISLPDLSHMNCIYEIVVKYILFISGFILIAIGIIKLLIAALPKDYSTFDLSELLSIDPKTYTYPQLRKLANRKKNTIIEMYHDVNQKKSIALRSGIIWSFCGFLVFIIFNNIILKLF